MMVYYKIIKLRIHDVHYLNVRLFLLWVHSRKWSPLLKLFYFLGNHVVHILKGWNSTLIKLKRFIKTMEIELNVYGFN